MRQGGEAEWRDRVVRKVLRQGREAGSGGRVVRQGGEAGSGGTVARQVRETGW